jgi:hypothetical protein
VAPGPHPATAVEAPPGGRCRGLSVSDFTLPQYSHVSCLVRSPCVQLSPVFFKATPSVIRIPQGPELIRPSPAARTHHYRQHNWLFAACQSVNSLSPFTGGPVRRPLTRRRIASAVLYFNYHISICLLVSSIETSAENYSEHIC